MHSSQDESTGSFVVNVCVGLLVTTQVCWYITYTGFLDKYDINLQKRDKWFVLSFLLALILLKQKEHTKNQNAYRFMFALRMWYDLCYLSKHFGIHSSTHPGGRSIFKVSCTHARTHTHARACKHVRKWI